MGPRAVRVVCLVCFLIAGMAWGADVKSGAPAEGKAADVTHRTGDNEAADVKSALAAEEEATPALLTVTPPPEAPAELSLQDAVKLALQHNQGFRQSIVSLLDARSNLLVAQQRWGLNLFGTSQRGDTESGQAGANLSYSALTGGTLQVQSVSNLLASIAGFEGYTATLSQPLLAGRGTASPGYEQLRAARSGYESGVLGYYLSRQDLTVAVISAYLNAVQQAQFVAIEEEGVKLAEQSVKDAELRVKEGLSIQIDLMRAQLQLAQAQSGAVLARQGQQDAMDQLLLLVGVQVQGSSKLTTEVAYEPGTQDVEAAMAYALENRPELQIADYEIQDREAALHIARSQRLPALNLFGGIEGAEFDFGQQAWTVGLQASLPIGARDLREAQNQSQWALLVSQQSLEDERQQVIADVRRQARAAEAARASVDIAAKAVELAQESLRQAQRLVEEGLDTNRNVLDAQTDLTTAKTNLVASKNSYYLAMVNLRLAMGMDVSEILAPTAAPAAASPAPANGATPPAVEGGATTPAPAGTQAAPSGTSSAPPAPQPSGGEAAPQPPAPGGADAAPPAAGTAGAPKE